VAKHIIDGNCRVMRFLSFTALPVRPVLCSTFVLLIGCGSRNQTEAFQEVVFGAGPPLHGGGAAPLVLQLEFFKSGNWKMRLFPVAGPMDSMSTAHLTDTIDLWTGSAQPRPVAGDYSGTYRITGDRYVCSFTRPETLRMCPPLEIVRVDSEHVALDVLLLRPDATGPSRYLLTRSGTW